MVERAEQLGQDQPPERVVAGEVDVELELLRRDLGQRLVGVVEGREPDLDVVAALRRP